MKAFVFSPSNQCIGKFDISDFEGIAPAVESFIRTHPETKRLSYVECGPRVWTITSVSPFSLPEGVVEEKPSVSPNPETYGLSDIAATSYRVAVFSVWCVFAMLLTETIFRWLKTGIWIPRETKWAFSRFPNLELWLSAPSDWLGLAKLVEVVSHTPWVLGIALILTVAEMVHEALRFLWFPILLVLFVALLILSMVLK